MSETTATVTTPAKAKKPAKTAAVKKPKAPANHPPVAEMVLASIQNLKERSGSSSQAIKKYIAANYKVEVDRLQPFIKKYLKSAVINGVLTQTKGKGANGSFKIANNPNKSAKSVAKKSTTTKKATKPVKSTETAAPSEAPKSKKSKTPKKGKAAKVVKKVKSPKAKKAKVEKKAKTPLKTTKSPKKAKTPKAKPAKKTTAKKAPQPKRSPKKA